MSGTVLCEVAEGIATVTLDRPEKLNAVTRGMAHELEAIARRCNGDTGIRAVVLTGRGERAFCVGTDVGELAQFDSLWAIRCREDYCAAIRTLRKPVICAINGYALGGGLEMALAADIRIASQNARLGAPEIKLGWIGGGGMAAHLLRSAGASNAALMLMTGDPIDAETALRFGLVSELCAPCDLAGRAAALAGVIASRAPIAAEHAKLALEAAGNMPLRMAMQYELELQTIAFATEDAKEGRAAFAAKRAPRFAGR